MPPKDINYFLAKAVVSSQFRKLLVDDPAAAISEFAEDYELNLTSKEREVITSIKASNLAEFSQKIESSGIMDSKGPER